MAVFNVPQFSNALEARVIYEQFRKAWNVYSYEKFFSLFRQS